MKIENLVVRFNNQKPILNNINVKFPSKGLIIIKGESGSGKTTFLKTIRGEIKASQGKILFDNEDILKINEVEIEKHMLTRCGFVFQDNILINDLSIYENIALMGEGVKKTYSRQHIKKLLRLVKLEKDENTLVRYLSGGEAQRVAIARALFFFPNLLLLDEPTSALDKENIINIFELLKNLSKDRLIIVVTHEDEYIDDYGDYVYEMEDGNLKVVKEKYEEYSIKEERQELVLKRPYKFIFSYLFKRMKNKPFRTLVSTLFLSLSLFLGGMGDILTSSVNYEIEKSLNGLADPSLFLMESKKEFVLHRDSLSLESAKNLFKKENEIVEIGTYYENDFNVLFKDRNECRIVSISTHPKLSAFDLNSINNFELIDLKKMSTFLKIESLSNDEIIFGLPPFLIKSLGNMLNISNPSIDNLSTYIKDNKVKIVFYAKNISWDYENEEIFTIKGIVESQSPTIYHTNPTFNQYFFEERMKLDSTLSWYEINEFPWTLRKRTIIYSKNEILDTFENSPLFYRYLFDEYGITKHYYKYAVSVSNNEYIDPFTIKQIIQSNNEIEGYFTSSEKGYKIIKNSIIHGFEGYFCLTNSNENLYRIENQLSIDRDNINFEKEVLINTVLAPSGKNTFTFSPCLEGVKISTKALSLLNLSKEDELKILYYDFDEFYLESWKIDDVYESDNIEIKVDNRKLNEFLNEVVGITSSYLKTTSVMFKCSSKFDMKSIMKKCEMLYKDYYFISPSNMMIESLEETTINIETGLNMFSVWLLMFSIILVKVIQDLYIQELDKDLNLLKRLGFGKKIYSEVRVFTKLILCLISLFFIVVISLSLFSLSNIKSFSAFFPISIIPNPNFYIKIIIYSFIAFFIKIPKIHIKNKTKMNFI